MIQLENRFIDVFGTIPIITYKGGNLVSKYDFGTEHDCLRFLSVNTRPIDKYPLIWLDTTELVLKGKPSRLQSRLKFILAYPTTSELENRERLKESFEKILDILFNNVIIALQQCGFITFKNSSNNQFARRFNYSETNDAESGFPDIWDAIVFSRDVEISDCDTKQINY